jgi:aspartate kinase
MTCGEMISASLIANTIDRMGVPSICMTGQQAGLITDDHFGDAKVIRVEKERMLRQLEEGKIIVVTGFQGVTETGWLTTLGRGGSDTTAAVVGVALDADSIEIFTDVDGIMTADPRIVGGARVLNAISYEECYQLSLDGAKVVDHKAVDVVKRAGKTLIVRNTFNDAPGTIIGPVSYIAKLGLDDEHDIITAITSKSGLVQVTVSMSLTSPENAAFLESLEQNKVSIDMINFFEDRKVFTIQTSKLPQVLEILERLKLEHRFAQGCAKLTLVGHRIHGIPGVMRRIVMALSRAGVEILQTSDSYTTIACLVHVEEVHKALNALHAEFGLSRDSETNA